MAVYIYKKYNISDFKSFVKERVGNDVVKFIEENDLWETVFNTYNNSSRNNNIYYDEDRVIDEINITILIMKRICR